MMVTMGISHKDKEQAERVGWFLRKVGWKTPHTIMLAHSQATNPIGLEDLFSHSFGKVIMHRLHDSDERGWPESCNHMFRRVCQEMCYIHKDAFLWLEPDIAPLAIDWVIRIEAEYKRLNKPFMGFMVDVPNVPIHMSGVAVYPADAVELAPPIVFVDKPAWDVAASEYILPLMARTDLIHHVWQNPKFEKPQDLDKLDPRAVLFHQEKTGGLLRLLLARYGVQGEPATGCSPPLAQYIPHETAAPATPAAPKEIQKEDRLAAAMKVAEDMAKKRKRGKRMKTAPRRHVVQQAKETVVAV